jgi:predicted lipoprotein with Yx(FWY)xxD motif
VKRSRPTTFLASVALIPLSALAVAACGGSGAATAATPASTSTSTPTAATAPKAKSAQTATVRIAGSGLGKILVNAGGRTLYLFKADKRNRSACFGQCAVAWPPLRSTGKPRAGAGVTASKLGTIARSGGARQVTYNGHPLYLFIADKKSGQTRGQGVVNFGGAWFVLSPAGNQISSRAARPAPKPAPPAPTPAPPVTTPAPPVTTPAPPPPNPIPQNNGGDGDGDNNGGPSDGDGNI